MRDVVHDRIAGLPGDALDRADVVLDTYGGRDGEGCCGTPADVRAAAKHARTPVVSRGADLFAHCADLDE
ncbi:hypothetical protein [Herbidospora daliensis]|uniref:hypothetical protein n=1 Tax=Herbidospora daliensis TaxID=295585 RepID=UPI0012F96F23|nr:hypothetical protein [Herbidospora daliensis]